MNDLPTLEHALYGAQGGGGYRFLARSPNFLDEWLPDAERLCTGFGERPAGVACPHAVFAQPLGKKHVAVVQIADQGTDDQGRPGALGFHVVVLPADLYAWLGADPFHIAAQLPPPWTAQGHLSPLACPAPVPQRVVADVQKSLKVEHSATLLGAAQALLDGGRVVLERSAPDEALVRAIWALLPTAARADLWPASFAFANTFRFHLLAVPRIEAEMFATYLLEAQAGDYPEGKYERDLQVAAESGDQGLLNALFGRRSYRETRRLALILLVIVLMFPVISWLINQGEKKQKLDPNPPADKDEDRFAVDPAEKFPALTPEQAERLRARLQALADELKVKTPPHTSGPVLAVGGAATGLPSGTAALLLLDRQHWTSPEALLLDALDQHLGTPDPKRAGRALRFAGPIERQLRALLYKHRVARYDDRKLSPAELVERLQEKLQAEKKP